MKTDHKASRLLSYKGATLIEIALTLPVIVLGILIFLWLGITIHDNSSLEAALSRSLRLAATRGVSENVGAEIIPDIENFNGRINDLLVHNVDATSGMAYYDTMASNTFAQNDLGATVDSIDDLPREYVYALVYFNEAIKQSIGSSVKFPCDADNIATGQGCVGCSFLVPGRDAAHSNDDEVLMASFGANIHTYVDPAPRRRMGLECRYQPADFLTGPINRIINLVTGSSGKPLIVLKKRQFMDIPEL